MLDRCDYDILIVGGGMVGASLALALNHTSLRVALIEAVPFRADAQPSYDDRAIALAYGTRRIFEGMGLWQAMSAQVTPIQRIHISERGRFGATRLDCRDEGFAALGYVAEARTLGKVLSEALGAARHIEIFCPATVTGMEVTAARAAVTIVTTGGERVLNARLVVAADGANSAVRQKLDIETVRWDYGQSAVIANVTPGRAHQNQAYERFTASGPLALLPMSADRCAVVWTVQNAQVDGVMGLSDTDFLAKLQQRFGRRLGIFTKPGVRHVYPLALVRAREHVRLRLALIGNAAHTLHPVAGQGFNLGIRDVAVLAQVIADAVKDGEDPGREAVLQRYATWRRRDHRKAIVLTDGLARLFTVPLAPVAMVRGLGLLAVDMIPPLKHVLVRQTMGLAGRLPRLARGLSLHRS